MTGHHPWDELMRKHYTPEERERMLEEARRELEEEERRDLTEVIEDRAERASTIIASQLPVTDWHAVIGDPNQADAICDRLLHDAHRIELKGRSMRRTHDAPKTPST